MRGPKQWPPSGGHFFDDRKLLRHAGYDVAGNLTYGDYFGVLFGATTRQIAFNYLHIGAAYSVQKHGCTSLRPLAILVTGATDEATPPVPA